ncbi:MAG: hypothetical protein ACFE0I_17820 [Elainellaceae cyanobacterium]
MCIANGKGAIAYVGEIGEIIGMEAGRSLRNLAVDPATIRVCISRHRNGIYADYFG